MMGNISFKEWLKILAVVSVVSILLAAINPFTHHYLVSFCIIFAMFGGVAIPFHIYAIKRNKITPECYMIAGAISGAIVGMAYPILSPFISDNSTTPIMGVILFGVGGILLGLLCSSIFWQVVVSKRYVKTAQSAELEKRKFNTKISLLNILGILFGYAIASMLHEIFYPELLRKEIASPLITAYGIFTLSFPFIFFLVHIFIVRLLVKGSLLALLFIFFEIAFIVVRSFYSLPLDLSIGAIPAIVMAVVCFFILRGMASQTFSETQKTAFRYATYGIVLLLASHIMITSFLTLSRDFTNQERSESDQWHAQFQPQEMEETEPNAETACLLLEKKLQEHQGEGFKNTIDSASDTLKQANVHFSNTSDISESRVRYYFRPISSAIAKAGPSEIEKTIIQYVMKGNGIDDYARWKATYGLFFEFSYDIFYTPRDDAKLNGPYVVAEPDSLISISIPLKDPLYIENFWKTDALQTPPGYLVQIMQKYGYEFDRVELLDAVSLSYVYDLNGLVQHMLLNDVYFFNVTLKYLAKREQGNSISKMILQNVSCSYPYRGELYDRPKGISDTSPNYSGYKRCHPWQARMHCPGQEKPIRHKTNICRQLGEPFPECPESGI